MDDAGMLKYTHGEFRHGITGEFMGMRHDFRGIEDMVHSRNTIREDILHMLKREVFSKPGIEIRYEEGVDEYVCLELP